jgi:hypothetical protein
MAGRYYLPAWAEKVLETRGQRKVSSRPPVLIYTDDIQQIAAILIERAGGVQPAHDAITRANEKRKKPRGAPPINDTHCLLIADAIQRHAIRRHKQCSRRRALLLTAELFVRQNKSGSAVDTTVSRWEGKLKRQSLQEYAATQPLEAVPRGPRRFSFRVRE